MLVGKNFGVYIYTVYMKSQYSIGYLFEFYEL